MELIGLRSPQNVIEPSHVKTCVVEFATKLHIIMSLIMSLLHMRKQRHRAKLISPFVFATRTIQSLNNFNLTVQASSHLLWLYSLIWVRPGRKDRFSHNEAHITRLSQLLLKFLIQRERQLILSLPGYGYSSFHTL